MVNNWCPNALIEFKCDVFSKMFKHREFRNSPEAPLYHYAHEDKLFARRLHDALQGRGVRCWLDEKQMLPGDDIYEQVDRGIRLWKAVVSGRLSVVGSIFPPFRQQRAKGWGTKKQLSVAGCRLSVRFFPPFRKQQAKGWGTKKQLSVAGCPLSVRFFPPFRQQQAKGWGTKKQLSVAGCPLSVRFFPPFRQQQAKGWGTKKQLSVASCPLSVRLIPPFRQQQAKGWGTRRKSKYYTDLP